MIHITDLPPRYQEQALRKAAEQDLRARERDGGIHARNPGSGEQAALCPPDGPARRKYGNRPENRAGIRFDSKKEARRFDELRAMEKAGLIRDLRLQAEFTLQEAYTTPEGERVRAIRYRADFVYRRQNPEGSGRWEAVVEDVKSGPTRTPEYRLKAKLMRERFGITIHEV